MRVRPILLLLSLIATGRPEVLPAQGGLAPIPPARGELAIRVQYPKAGSVLNLRDSTFLFGSVGDGQASLTINGASVHVEPNGAWLAWVAVPSDSQPRFALAARSGARTARAELQVTRAGWVRRQGAWALPSSMQPTGDLWRPAGERLILSVQARAGATLRLRRAGLPAIPLLPVPAVVLDSSDAAETTYQGIVIVDSSTAYSGWLAADASEVSGAPILEVVLAGDTTAIPWPLFLHAATHPIRVRLDDDPSRLNATDGLVNGRNRPGGNYHWFFPNGTIATADARDGESVRLRLGDGAIAWVARSELTLIDGPPGPRATMGSPLLSATAEGITMRIPLDVVVPHQVRASPEEFTISLFGVTGDADWIRYPVGSEFVSWVDWQQRTSDRIELTLRFGGPLLGWRVRAERDALLFEFRQTPRIDAEAPLRGRLVVLDAGHPPEGTCGPTGLCESVATLNVARIAAELLRREGAIVHLTREDAKDLALTTRVARADAWNAEALVSIHLNAHPDGVNPFTNSGTSTFFQHPQSLLLARTTQEAMVERFRIPDGGVARGDLALVRPTWYPAILTEGLYLMIPIQEAAMRTSAGQDLYAESIVAGLRDFFASLAMSTNAGVERLPVVPPSVFREP